MRNMLSNKRNLKLKNKPLKISTKTIIQDCHIFLRKLVDSKGNMIRRCKMSSLTNLFRTSLACKMEWNVQQTINI